MAKFLEKPKTFLSIRFATCGQQQGKAETDVSFGGDIFGGNGSGGSGVGSVDSNSPHGAGIVCTPLLTTASFLLTHSCSLIQLCR
jgi:hypothetical protein